MRVALCLALMFGLTAFAHADIYKCTDSQGIAYQWTPCASGQTETVMRTPRSEPAPLPPPKPTEALAYGRDVAFRRRAVEIGISDDEVLNLPGWGVPNRIERSRAGRIYREQWVYELPGRGARRLHFANAKLTAMEFDQPSADQLVSFTAR